MAAVLPDVNKINYRHPSYAQIVPYGPGIPRPIPSLPFASYATMRLIEKAKSNRSLKSSKPVIGPVEDRRVPPSERKEYAAVDRNSLASSNINDITLVDFDWSQFNKDGIESLNTRYITLPTIPRTLEFDGSPNWAVIPSVGRNTPFFHYSGSEDTLSFTIDWYAREESREDVIFACRWLEAKSKADGYKEDPHRIAIIWGKENLLLRDSLWIVFKAPYKLSEFQRQECLFPNQAFQEVVLKRVCDYNLRTNELYGSVDRNFESIDMEVQMAQ